jgi:hypothetical protein
MMNAHMTVDECNRCVNVRYVHLERLFGR